MATTAWSCASSPVNSIFGTCRSSNPLRSPPREPSFKDHGLVVASMGSSACFHSPDTQERERNLDSALRMAEIAAGLGAPSIRVFGDHIQPGSDRKQTAAWIAESLTRARGQVKASWSSGLAGDPRRFRDCGRRERDLRNWIVHKSESSGIQQMHFRAEWRSAAHPAADVIPHSPRAPERFNAGCSRFHLLRAHRGRSSFRSTQCSLRLQQ